jgi:hypothetical protein
VSFFSDLSEEAAFLLSRLDSPAARQMLVYHHTVPPGTTGESDPLRAAFLADLADVGSYPTNVRRVAVANGSGQGQHQGFAPGTQLIDYEYTSLLVDITGNVWAVPDGGPSLPIFAGLIDFILLPADELTVSATGTLPYDSAPGGYRGTMAQMDTTETGYGDIVALHDNHCFIPTVSALDLDVADLFHDIAGDPDLPSRTPFDAVYAPAENQEHVSITPQSVTWLLAEILPGALAAPETGAPSAAALFLGPGTPNPFSVSTSLRFRSERPDVAMLGVYDVHGRLVRTLLRGPVAAGWQRATWDGRNDGGTPVAAGVYYCRLRAGSATDSRRVVLLR